MPVEPSTALLAVAACGCCPAARWLLGRRLYMEWRALALIATRLLLVYVGIRLNVSGHTCMCFWLSLLAALECVCWRVCLTSALACAALQCSLHAPPIASRCRAGLLAGRLNAAACCISTPLPTYP